MWYAGRPAPEQCEGCTYFNEQARELDYLYVRDINRGKDESFTIDGSTRPPHRSQRALLAHA